MSVKISAIIYLLLSVLRKSRLLSPNRWFKFRLDWKTNTDLNSKVAWC